MLKHFFVVSICLMVLTFYSFGQEEVNLVVKEHFPIRNLSWDSTDSLFAYLEQDIIFLRNEEENELVGAIDFPSVLDFSLYHEEGTEEQLIAGSADGTFAVWGVSRLSSTTPPTSSETSAIVDINTFPPDYIANINAGRAVDLLTFSKNSNYVADYSAEDENLGIRFRLRYTNELVSKDIGNYPSPAYSMVFSSDNLYLAAASLDGLVRIWNSDNGNFYQEFPLDSQNKVAISYIHGTYNLLIPKNSVSATVIDPTGRELMEIKARSPIRHMQLLSDGRRVAILTEENRLEIYDLENGKHLGYLPSFNVTSITSFDFNSNDSLILMGHEDGSIYKVNVNKNLIGVMNMPVLRLIDESEVVVKGGEFTERIPQPTLYSQESNLSEKSFLEDSELNPFFKKPSHGVEVLGGTTFLPKPHVMSLDLSVGYINNILLHPFYLGGHFTWSVGFPDKNFPYTYQIKNEIIGSPLMLTFALGIPFGIILTPFEANRDIEISAEVNLGSALHYMWNRKFGRESISSHIYPAFVGSLALGVGWKGFTFRIHGDYDTQLGFMFSMNLGYTFTFPHRQRK